MYIGMTARIKRIRKIASGIAKNSASAEIGTGTVKEYMKLH
jgi:hypothetical protein